MGEFEMAIEGGNMSGHQGVEGDDGSEARLDQAHELAQDLDDGHRVALYRLAHRVSNLFDD